MSFFFDRSSVSVSGPAAPAVPDDVVARLGPAVLRTFAEEDFHRVDMRSLAKAAGMSFATIYRYFGDKEAMLFWFIAFWTRSLYDEALPCLVTDEPAWARIRNYLRVFLRFYETNPDVGTVIFLTVPLKSWMKNETYRADRNASGLMHFLVEAQAAGDLRSDLSAVALFDAFGGLFNRAFLMWEYRKRSYSLERQLDTLISLLAAGIDAPDASTNGSPHGKASRA
jgi:AcrR family transcriptional regulator